MFAQRQGPRGRIAAAALRGIAQTQCDGGARGHGGCGGARDAEPHACHIARVYRAQIEIAEGPAMNDEWQLIDGYLDGERTADEQRRLAEWLAADREHIRQFVRETQLHRQLRETMLASQFQTDALAAVERAERKPSPSPIRTLADWLAQLFGFPWPPARRGAWVAVAACLALVAGLSVWYFGPTVGEPLLAEVQGSGLSLERAGQTLAAEAGTRLQS